MVLTESVAVPGLRFRVVLLERKTEGENIIGVGSDSIEIFVLFVPVEDTFLVDPDLVLDVAQALNLVVVLWAGLDDALAEFYGFIDGAFSEEAISFDFPEFLRQSVKRMFVF